MGIVNIELIIRVCLSIFFSLAVASVFLSGIAMIESYRKEEIIAKSLFKLIVFFGILMGVIIMIIGMTLIFWR
jgi:hypothetical protein